ncbi:MAG: nucleoside triphosphate pyrophosphohydrolase [marine benthic group bacterium]|jgi:MazG family protein|nr:nucleoside triphosphate pyrophosphohydrolase [Candidatus Carthagonibacter metallireducens]MCL7985723.1 nucleoside triphosphate pyrophosphohydrolase [Gemmatimonadota bacterium]MCL7989967.1 nucleoside triphosphate pyrophosphohydrolase [Gemmatimonadota bacterium]
MSEEQQIFPDPEARSRHLARACNGDTSLGRSLALVRYLRSGCAWDAKQTPATLRPYLLEEAHEVAEAIRGGDETELADELGDLLLNIAFQVVLAEERGAFEAESVVEGLERKMIERHPHLYGEAENPPDWEELKAQLRARARGTHESGEAAQEATTPDPFDGIPGGLEPLSRALRLQDRAAARGFDWPDAGGALEKLHEEIAELESELDSRSSPLVDDARADRVQDELGDLLFAAVNVARLAGAHPSVALDRASAKFERRFRDLLRLADERGIDPDEADLATLDRLWDEVKLNSR